MMNLFNQGWGNNQNKQVNQQQEEHQKTVELGKQILLGKKRTYEFEIDLTHIDPRYKGKFKVHHPTVAEQIQIGVARTQILGGMNNSVDDYTYGLATVIATLGAVLDERPDWFNPAEIEDPEVFEEVFRKYHDWYSSFRKRNENKDKENS